MSVIIRPLRTEEASGFLTLRRRLFIDEITNSGIDAKYAHEHIKAWDINPDSTANLEDRRQRGDEFYFRVVEHAGSLAGLLSAELHPEGLPDSDSTRIRLIHLDASLRGQGVGKRLLNEFFEEYGGRDTYLDVLEGNQSAIGFYEAQGFVSTGATREVKIGGSEIFHETVFNQMVRPAQ